MQTISAPRPQPSGVQPAADNPFGDILGLGMTDDIKQPAQPSVSPSDPRAAPMPTTVASQATPDDFDNWDPFAEFDGDVAGGSDVAVSLQRVA